MSVASRRIMLESINSGFSFTIRAARFALVEKLPGEFDFTATAYRNMQDQPMSEPKRMIFTIDQTHVTAKADCGDPSVLLHERIANFVFEKVEAVAAVERDCKGCFYASGSNEFPCPIACILSTIDNKDVIYKRIE